MENLLLFKNVHFKIWDYDFFPLENKSEKKEVLHDNFNCLTLGRGRRRKDLPSLSSTFIPYLRRIDGYPHVWALKWPYQSI